MLAPKRVKWRKQQKGRIRGAATRGTKVAFGQFGLQSLDRAWLTARQIEAARVAMTRHIRRGGKVFIRIFPDKPVGKKPAETRMGKGKATTDAWVAVNNPGRELCELEGVPEPIARRAMQLAAAKLPVRTRFVSRSGGL